MDPSAANNTVATLGSIAIILAFIGLTVVYGLVKGTRGQDASVPEQVIQEAEEKAEPVQDEHPEEKMEEMAGPIQEEHLEEKAEEEVQPIQEEERADASLPLAAPTNEVLVEKPRKQSIIHIALVVRDYDEAIEFYTKKLHFTLVEDTYQPAQDKRWVVVAPPNSTGTTVLLAKASKPEQEPFIGNQTGGRVFLFLNSDDFWRDYNEMIVKGIKFVRFPKEESYGMVAVFEDLYGNLWDLLQINKNHPLYEQNSTSV